MKPFVKWAGGKRQILDKIKSFVNESVDSKDNPLDDFTNQNYTYIEPFLGGGAVFFSVAPKKAIINDLNSDLMNAYSVIKSDQFEGLINQLREYDEEYRQNPDEFYYHKREEDRQPEWANETDIQRAARMIFLNRTCYNGLYRVNSKGQFNTPLGRYVNPTICDEENIREIHDYFSSAEIKILNGSYEEAIKLAKDGDVIYIDPPYDYEDDDGFTKYQMQGFSFDDFKKLKLACDAAIDRGAYVIISNNATTKVMDLFNQDPQYTIYYDSTRLDTLRSINCDGENRRTGREVIFWGMPNKIPFPQANSIEKIIALLNSDEEVLSDKEKAMEILDVKSDRQVAYYLSALRYFKFISQSNKFTDSAKSIKNNTPAIEETIFDILIKDSSFSNWYKQQQDGQKLETIKIAKQLHRQRRNISISTSKRRASTIKNWVEWMAKYKPNAKLDT
jgi:DNA adenine methylase